MDNTFHDPADTKQWLLWTEFCFCCWSLIWWQPLPFFSVNMQNPFFINNNNMIQNEMLVLLVKRLLQIVKYCLFLIRKLMSNQNPSLYVFPIRLRCSCTSIYELLSFSANISNALILFTNPSARAGYGTRSIFKRSLTGLNSEFSFS